jgi:WhiB family redox-sensing transcriptional regulator
MYGSIEEAWTVNANCEPADADEFINCTDIARALCAGCLVRKECLDYALAHNELGLIRGGLNDQERQRIKAAREMVLPDPMPTGLE